MSGPVGRPVPCGRRAAGRRGRPGSARRVYSASQRRAHRPAGGRNAGRPLLTGAIFDAELECFATRGERSDHACLFGQQCKRRLRRSTPRTTQDADSSGDPQFTTCRGCCTNRAGGSNLRPSSALRRNLGKRYQNTRRARVTRTLRVSWGAAVRTFPQVNAYIRRLNGRATPGRRRARSGSHADTLGPPWPPYSNRGPKGLRRVVGLGLHR